MELLPVARVEPLGDTRARDEGKGQGGKHQAHW